MGRKPICNVEKKIMDEVLREDFKYGIYSLSTKAIAAHLKISEPVIFSHFKTKQNLLDRTFEYAFMQVNVPSRIPSVDSIIAYDGQERFVRFFKEALEEPECVMYAENYLHSSYYHPEFAYIVQKGLIESAVSFFNAHNHRDEESNRYTAVGFLALIVSGLSRFASHALPNDEKELRLFSEGLLVGMKGVSEAGD
jgi:AcrR family transcriptional regulator